MSLFTVGLNETRNKSVPRMEMSLGIMDQIVHSKYQVTQSNVNFFVTNVGKGGCTFCPATFDAGFYDTKPNMKIFKQIQLFAMEFNRGISFEKVKKIADRYSIPILFAYEPLDSTDQNQFNVVFLHDTWFTQPKWAELTLEALLTIFPEADSSCKDLTQIYLGGNKLLYFDETIPTMNVESLVENMIHCLKDRHGTPDYRQYVEKFVEDNNISLTSINSVIAPLLDNLPIPETDKTIIPEKQNTIDPSISNTCIDNNKADSNSVNKLSFKISLDPVGYNSKPTSHEVGKINNRIGKSPHSVEQDKIKEVIEAISVNGHSFAPATFKEGQRNKNHFEQMQVFALDFDKGISFDEIKNRTDKYNLHILSAYETMNSENCDRFRVIFLNDTSITDVRVAEMMQQALITIYPEADKNCKNIAHMYFGGKRLIYFDESVPMINPESLIRNMSIYLRDVYRDTNYKRKIREFSRATGVALTSKDLPDVKVVDSLPELSSTTDIGSGATINNNNISPIHYVYIMENGENLLNGTKKIYRINFDNSSTSTTSVSQSDKKEPRNHREYRKSVLQDIRSKCQLFRAFENGTERLHHDELFGLATNIIQVESGISWFKNILQKHSKYDEYVDKYDYWERNLKYMNQNEYKPQSCNGFCPYKNQCQHGTNILSSSKIKDNHIEVLANYELELVSLDEAREDVRKAIFSALDANDDYIYVVKGATSTGKSESYLEYIKNNPDKKTLINASTNLLKNDLMGRTKKKGIPDSMVSPSLHEIRSELPLEVWNQIQKFWDTGRHKAVDMYINKLIEKNDKRCAKILDDYMEKKKDFNTFRGHAFTTHKKFQMMNAETLGKFSNIIIDEDFIFKSVATNHETVTVSELEALKDELGPGDPLYKKIKEILKYVNEKRMLFTLSPIEWDDENDDDESTPNYSFDVPSLYRAEYFCFREASQEPNLQEDSITFMKAVKLPKRKLIIASATADEKVYNYFFKDNIVKFYDCKIPRLVGNLNQYPDKTMSRDCLIKDPGMLDYIQKVTGFSRMITFKMFNRGPMWFGNAEGFDGWRGLSYNIVGTPHFPPWIYFLFASSLELDFDEKAKLENRIIEHNGCRVKLASFDDEVLRAIQFWMIESELSQSVGRGRLAIEENCTVNVFSNFPLLQARQGQFDWSKYSK